VGYGTVVEQLVVEATTIEYVGSELELFSEARNWKEYFRDSLSRFITGDVAEVGAGLGANLEVFATTSSVRTWTGIEPDPSLLEHLARRVAGRDFPFPVAIRAGTLRDVSEEPLFNTIIYIDVLEHIRDHLVELQEATKRLRPGGRIIVLSPAYQFLFSNFDQAVGHYRRYSKTSLRRVARAPLVEEAAFYLDSVGALASFANKLALRQSMPSSRQIRFWDRVLVPISRILDEALLHTFGRSVVLVWRKPIS
jgi:SAM-dependent methyltransferase